jgi:hypothetical protein
MKKSTTFLQDIKRILLLPLTDLQLFFTAKFYKENWHKHFSCSFLIIFPILELLVLFTDIHKTNFYFMGKMWSTTNLFILFTGYGIGFCGNFLREWILSIKKQTPFSLEDCRFGGYGGALASIVIIILLAL